jgi:DNA-directed RNA polymerase specialized sigma24 family protein
MTKLPEQDRKAKWVLSQSAFQGLLSWFDEDEETAGQQYVEIRRRLVQYFDRKNCSAPHELADETLNRVARRLEEEGKITGTSPREFCFITARYIFLESLRSRKHHEPLDERIAVSSEIQESGEWDQLSSDCLKRCLKTLDPEDRNVIIGYYRGERSIRIENRKLIAAKLGVSMNALSIRACRIRIKLESCIRECLRSGK